MRLNLIYFAAVLFLSGFIITGCCNCGSGENNIIKGRIVVVGNEPFARVAITTSNDRTYVLECSKELQSELLQKQGSFFAVRFSSSKIENEIPIIVVEEATPLKENTNN